MRLRSLALVTLLAALALPTVEAVPATAQSPAQSYVYGQKQFRNACRPPLKYAAGACLRRCPAGYEDMGRTCRLRRNAW